MRAGIDYRPALVNAEGIGRYTRELVRAMIELGEPELALFGYTLKASRYDHATLGLGRGDRRLFRWRVPSRAVAAALGVLPVGADDLLRGVDLFHCTQYRSLKLRKARLVATIHDIAYITDSGIVSDRSAERMESHARRMARDGAALLVPTEHVRGQVIEHLGAEPERVHVTHLGCDHAARLAAEPAAGTGRDRPYVLTVSRVDARKNHPRMLQAFERLVAGGAPHEWVVAGPPGHGHEEFVEMLGRSPARERVSWDTEVDDRRLAQLYAGAEVYLLASLDEGFGSSPLEAMACGVATVAGDVPAVRETCLGAACLVDPTSVDAIHAGLVKTVEDSEYRESLRASGLDNARRFTWRATAAATVAAYEACLQARAGA